MLSDSCNLSSGQVYRFIIILAQTFVRLSTKHSLKCGGITSDIDSLFPSPPLRTYETEDLPAAIFIAASVRRSHTAFFLTKQKHETCLKRQIFASNSWPMCLRSPCPKGRTCTLPTTFLAAFQGSFALFFFQILKSLPPLYFYVNLGNARVFCAFTL